MTTLTTVPSRTNVYVDGFNLYYGCLKGTPYKWLDIGALCRLLLPNDHINKIRYFTAKVSGRPPDLQQPQRQMTYLRALETIPNLSIHYGHFLVNPKCAPLQHPNFPGQTVWVMNTEEKGSDVNLATYLLLDAFQNDYEVAVVISNDGDLKLPVALVQSELHRAVGVVNPHPAWKRSRAMSPSFFKQIRPGALKASQFSPTLTDSVGTITKPLSW